MVTETTKQQQDTHPWPGLKLACVRILQLYCKVFEQPDLLNIARYFMYVHFYFRFCFLLSFISFIHALVAFVLLRTCDLVKNRGFCLFILTYDKCDFTLH